jgi:hypothetical protein
VKILGAIGDGLSAFIQHAFGSTRNVQQAVTVAQRSNPYLATDYFDHEAETPKILKHPFIIGFERNVPECQNRPPAIITVFMPNGSLADQLAGCENREFCKLRRGSRDYQGYAICPLESNYSSQFRPRPDFTGLGMESETFWIRAKCLYR